MVTFMPIYSEHDGNWDGEPFLFFVSCRLTVVDHDDDVVGMKNASAIDDSATTATQSKNSHMKLTEKSDW
jgi:hypothetical protein